MVFVMYGVVLAVVFAAVALAATRDARLADRLLSQIVRPNNESVQNNV